MFNTIKILDLNPNVPEEQMYDLLCEKFSNFLNVSVNVVQQGEDRVAYLSFMNCKDASVALNENGHLALFGCPCRAVPVYNKRGGKRSMAADRSSADFSKNDDYPSDLFTNFEDHERASLSPEEPNSEDGPQRYSGGYRTRGFRGARRSVRGRGWRRGFASSRARGAGSKPYLLTSARGRSGQKPYLLTQPRDNDERKPLDTAATDGQKPYPSTQQPASEITDEAAEKEPNHILYIGAMDPTVKPIDLTRLFNNFGFVLNVEIKNPGATVSYAFVHFLTVDMACLAKQEMEGKPIGRTVPKLGFGRTVPNKCLWVGGLGAWSSEDMLRFEFGQFGDVVKVEWPKNRDYAFVLFATMQDAADAKQVMHGSLHGDPPHLIRVCYGSNLQMNADVNYRGEFPKFPKIPRPENQPKKKHLLRSSGTRFPPQKHKSCDSESRESHRRRRRSLERSRSHSRPRKRSRSHSRARKSHRSHTRSRRKERKSPSPYARSISRASSDNDMSAISETSSESVGSSDRNRQRKRLRKSSLSRSPVNKLLKNPSPPKSAMKDERTVVLRSEPQQSVAAAAGTTSGIFTAVVNPLHTAAVPPYVPPVDPVVYYPPVASTLPPTVYPPPVHIPPPDFYMPPNPVMPPFQQHLQPLTSYPPVAADNIQPMPSSVPPAQTSTYLPSSVAGTTPVKEVQKSASVGVAAKFPKVWSGALVLRNAAFVVDFHLLSGSVLLVNSLLGSNVEPGSEADCPVLKIAQRLRLDQPDKLDELDRRLKKAGRTGCSVLVATSAPAQVDDDANVVQQHPLSSLVSYLLQKQVAAVVPLPAGVLHAFPPCQFATDFLHREAPGLPANCPTEEELLVVLCEL